MTLHVNRLCLAPLLLLSVTFPSGAGERESPLLAVGLVPGIYQAMAGVWEEVDTPITKNRIQKEFSWGIATILPNWGFIFELGTSKPYIQIWGDKLIVSGARILQNGRIEMDVVDLNVTGSGAFVQVIFTSNPDGTGMIDFQRADGSLYGSMRCERLYGPRVK